MAEFDPTHVSTHFEFGANWARFADTISPLAIAEARKGLERLFPAGEIRDRRFLDIGCGSGLHSLAALQSGAAEVSAIDIDPRSVVTTQALLGRLAPSKFWRAQVQSVFDMPAEPRFDIVYSWGVLHHTGDMRRAIACAYAKVAPGGLLCLALYRRTLLCGAWRIEKWIYSRSPRSVRSMLETLYVGAMRIFYRITGRDFEAYVADYVGARGMDFMTDVRDWLGGYPYESVSEAEVRAIGQQLHLRLVRSFCHKPGVGLFGTGCDEYVFLRPAS
jgi:2-polyprenyl-6-hydroxyphenyl methylase/3-demethylubiquinone-9 3-methyltransferase